MKQLILMIGAILICTVSFAQSEEGLGKGSSKLKELNAIWKQTQTITPKQDDKNDITMVYGGKDISLRPSIAPSTTVV